MGEKTFNDLPSGASSAAGDEVFPVWQSAAARKLTKAQYLALLGLSPWSGVPYEEGAWTPVPTFATPGDLVVTSNTLVGRYRRLGNMVEVTCEGNFTPTFTTAAGDFRVTGLPFVSFTTGMGAIGDQNQRFSYTGSMRPRVPAGQSYATMRLLASAAAAANLTYAGLSSGNAHTLAFAAKYWISA